MDSGCLTPAVDATCQGPRIGPDRVVAGRARASDVDAEAGAQPYFGDPRGTPASHGERPRRAVEHRNADQEQPRRPGWNGATGSAVAVRAESSTRPLASRTSR